MRQQGQINRPEHTAGGSQNKGTEKLQKRAGPSPLEVGGRGVGKGANSAPEKPPPPTRHKGPLFLSKDFLRPDRRRALGPRREKARHIPGDCAQASGCPGRSQRREKAHRARGEAAQTSGCPGRSPRREKARRTWGRGHQNFWLPGRNTASAPHTQRHLPAAPGPPRSRTELN